MTQSVVLVFTLFLLSSCGLLEDDKSEGRNEHHIWVSPKGDDANSGDYHVPFKTIARAQIEARKKTSLDTNIVVNIKDGIYRLDKTLQTSQVHKR